MRRLLDALYLGAGYLAAAFLVLIFLLMMIMSVGRQFSLNIPAGDDFASWAMAALSFLGLAHTFKSGEMIRVGLMLERLDGWKRHALEVFSHSVALMFIGFFTWQAGKLTHDSLLFNDMSTGVISIPLWIPQMALVIGLGLLTVAIADELVHVIKGNRPSYEKPPPKDVDELLKRITEGGGA